jgi:nucleoside phosphorylase
MVRAKPGRPDPQWEYETHGTPRLQPITVTRNGHSPMATVTAQPETIDRATAEALKPVIHLLIVTATDVESEAVWQRMQPLPGKSHLFHAFLGNQTYRIGIFGRFGAAHVQCRMGTSGRDASLVTTLEALETWAPEAVIMPGIAFGRNRQKQSLCDLLIGEEIRNYEPERVGKVTIFRGNQPRASPVLLNRALNLRGRKFTTITGQVAGCHSGLLLSGEKLIDKKEFKARLFRKLAMQLAVRWRHPG